MPPTAPRSLGAVWGIARPDIRRAELPLFKVDQRVLVIDHASPHHAMFGKVIVVTLGQDRFLYWLRLDTNPKGGLFGEEQLQAA
jgi:hypothetical protein